MQRGQDPRHDRGGEIRFDRVTHERQKAITEVLNEDGEDGDAAQSIELGQGFSCLRRGAFQRAEHWAQGCRG